MAIKYDYQLIESARQGDSEAINTLLTQCVPDIKRFARTVCATPEDVEDALQETIIILSKKINTLRIAAAFTSWLFRVVKRECYRLLRLRTKELLTDTLPEVQDTSEYNRIQSTLLSQEIVTAITRLPIIYRQVLIMRDIEEMTAPETAMTLGITVEAVKSRLHRARKIIRATLQQYLVD
ncbi:RNA polymerase sigma factor [Nostoc sp. 'Lobaria pulmonaria (5183) cyanobiont']|uniref:RNA polymerase sigma factor n=1 Tax=Nostoc sp. 'Lobaria pulmonaria (5183) cyanobiont' TaxID=1618022 RepID=UPI000CF35930|nr:RNA polymerase sigma factor [Nostoc sp. 'Lobaria pulmonaria (5183) cyanobiont']AVH74392.1 DNA-directed RNA polymerase sigma factor RpoE [Nostoc sp. 'Lobaria pulmonaria (5183) cyanobiont']